MVWIKHEGQWGLSFVLIDSFLMCNSNFQVNTMITWEDEYSIVKWWLLLAWMRNMGDIHLIAKHTFVCIQPMYLQYAGMHCAGSITSCEPHNPSPVWRIVALACLMILKISCHYVHTVCFSLQPTIDSDGNMTIRSVPRGIPGHPSHIMLCMRQHITVIDRLHRTPCLVFWAWTVVNAQSLVFLFDRRYWSAQL